MQGRASGEGYWLGCLMCLLARGIARHNPGRDVQGRYGRLPAVGRERGVVRQEGFPELAVL